MKRGAALFHLLLFLAAATPLAAADRVALVIGNNKYTNLLMAGQALGIPELVATVYRESRS